MWQYKNVSRAEFEKRKDFVESILVEKGASPTKLSRPHQITSYGGKTIERIISDRTIFQYKNKYFRVSEVLFEEKPFIVIEWTDSMNNVMMEDYDPFPYDLTDKDITIEVENALG